MRESYVEGLAAHDGSESCVVVREDVGEALTGVRTGRVFSREISLPSGYGSDTSGSARDSNGSDHLIGSGKSRPRHSNAPCSAFQRRSGSSPIGSCGGARGGLPVYHAVTADGVAAISNTRKSAMSSAQRCDEIWY